MDWWAAGADWRPGAGQAQYKAADAMCLSIVRGCVRMRASFIGQLPVRAYTTTNGETRPTTPQPPLVTTPSGRVLRAVWLQQWSTSIDLFGNAYGAVVARDAADYPKQVEWLFPGDMRVDESASSRPAYVYKGVPFPARDLIHVAPFTAPGSIIGLAPLERDGLVDLGKMAQEFGRRWFKDGAHPSALLMPERDPGDSGAAALKARWRNVVKGGEVAVLPQSVKYQPIQANAEQSKFLETVRGVQVDVCMSYLMPPEMFGIAASGSSVTYANREQRMSDVLVTAVNYPLTVFQEVLTANLPRSQEARFGTGALLRSDLTTRYQSYEIADRIGLLSINEMRALEDRSPVPGGDTVRRPPVDPPARSNG